MIMPASTTSTAGCHARMLDRYASVGRIRDRYMTARGKTAAVVLRDCPRGWHWGWFANAEPPMHIVPMRAGHHNLGKVYLEDLEGRRIFRAEGKIPQPVLAELAHEVEMHDLTIEDSWCRFAAARGWIQAGVDGLGGRLMVMVFSGRENERIHGYDVAWSRIIGHRKPVEDDVDVDIEGAELILGPRETRPIRIPLRHVIFETTGAVIDRVTVTEPDWGRDQSARLHGIVDRYVREPVPRGA